MQKQYEQNFNKKIDYFSKHPEYEVLRKQADKALQLHTGCGLNAIIAHDFMNRIIAADLAIIEDRLNGKNKLEWEKIKNKHGEQ